MFIENQIMAEPMNPKDSHVYRNQTTGEHPTPWGSHIPFANDCYKHAIPSGFKKRKTEGPMNPKNSNVYRKKQISAEHTTPSGSHKTPYTPFSINM